LRTCLRCEPGFAFRSDGVAGFPKRCYNDGERGVRPVVLYGAKNLERREQAYDLLALAARETWNWQELPDIVRLEGGKPCFGGEETRQFNLSHSGSFALCALDEKAVGVDIQIVKSWRPGLPQRVCSEWELAWLEERGGSWDAFALLWALKESKIKQSGRGLRDSVRGISVPLPEKEASLYELDGLWFRTYTGDGWAAAACGVNPPPEELLWRAL